MIFLIYGAGALGQAMGCMLSASGQHVDLILRDRFHKAISEKGLSVTGIFGDYTADPNTLDLYTDIRQTTKTYDYVLITTKSYDTEFAVNEINTLSHRALSIVSMQNGCGNLEKLVNTFGTRKSLGARVITGFEIGAPGLVNITVSADSIHVGSSQKGTISDQADRLAACIEHAGHPCEAVEDIHQSLFAKLLYNCTLNPLGAILGVHYGALVEKEETRQIMDQVIEETFSVIHALGGKTPWQDATAYKEVFYKTLIPATYNHRPSMLQDLEAGKPTEVNSLIGYVSRQGKKFNIHTPHCDMLTALVQFKESNIGKTAGFPTAQTNGLSSCNGISSPLSNRSLV